MVKEFYRWQRYDRKGESKGSRYLGSSAPHGATTRLSYTCPAGKIAMVELLSCSLWRITEATTLGQAGVYWRRPVGAETNEFLYAFLLDNTVGAKDTRAIGATIVLFAGDKIEGVTFDLSTDGSCNYFLAYKVTEFEA